MDTCGVFLFLMASASDRNCFLKHHLQAKMKFLSFVWYYKTGIVCLVFAPLFYKRWKTNNTFSILYSSCVILQWVLCDYKNVYFICFFWYNTPYLRYRHLKLIFYSYLHWRNCCPLRSIWALTWYEQFQVVPFWVYKTSSKEIL